MLIVKSCKKNERLLNSLRNWMFMKMGSMVMELKAREKQL
jgi:hypothetical protein